MHPRNPYRTAPNFTELAESYPALREQYVNLQWLRKVHSITKYLGCSLVETNAGTSIDFHDSGAQRLVHVAHKSSSSHAHAVDHSADA